MVGILVAIAVILLLVGVAAWAGRTEPTPGNGDNITSARKYGAP